MLHDRGREHQRAARRRGHQAGDQEHARDAPPARFRAPRREDENHQRRRQCKQAQLERVEEDRHAGDQRGAPQLFDPARLVAQPPADRDQEHGEPDQLGQRILGLAPQRRIEGVRHQLEHHIIRRAVADDLRCENVGVLRDVKRERRRRHSEADRHQDQALETPAPELEQQRGDADERRQRVVRQASERDQGAAHDVPRAPAAAVGQVRRQQVGEEAQRDQRLVADVQARAQEQLRAQDRQAGDAGPGERRAGAPRQRIDQRDHRQRRGNALARDRERRQAEDRERQRLHEHDRRRQIIGDGAADRVGVDQPLGLPVLHQVERRLGEPDLVAGHHRGIEPGAREQDRGRGHPGEHQDHPATGHGTQGRVAASGGVSRARARA